MILPGSYANGFSPRDGAPLYPSLWRGRVGSWAPLLGPTGLSVRDWSGFANHGTLTNMDAASDWVTSQGRYALDFDATNDFVSLGSTQLLFSGQPFTISWWERATSATTYPARFRFRSATNTFGVFRSTDATYQTLAFGEWRTITGVKADAPTIAASVGVWRHFMIVGHAGPQSNTASDYTVFCDGVSAMTSSCGPFNTFAGTNNQIGWDSLNNGANCQIDDVAVYSRTVTPREARILASRRGIAYELSPRRRASSGVAFNRRRRLLVGAGS